MHNEPAGRRCPRPMHLGGIIPPMTRTPPGIGGGWHLIAE
jgi:hypothetical protein